METQADLNYRRIAEAIRYLQANFKRQPSLDDLAAHLHMSPFHLQRMFTEWAGVSPKKFLQYLSLAHAKELLRADASLFDASLDAGLSGPGRLHDLFVSIEGMTPGQYKGEGSLLPILYRFAASLFGPVLVASTPHGVCHVAFADDPEHALRHLRRLFPKADILEGSSPHQEAVLGIWGGRSGSSPIRLHLKGTPFQLKVWEALLRVPMGRLTTYGAIAAQIGKPEASRAVGTAVGDNPAAFLIPCHRVIRSSGVLGGYHWGEDRKSAMVAWESARVYGDD